MAASPDMLNRTAPANMTGRRPVRSEIGPQNSWPIANAIKYAVSNCCTASLETLSSDLINGRVGVRMVIPTTAVAVHKAKNNIGGAFACAFRESGEILMG